MVLYTPAIGPSTLTEGGVELVLEAQPGSRWLPLGMGRIYLARVREVRSEGNTPLTSNTMVLSLGPAIKDRGQNLGPSALLHLSTASVSSLRGAKTALSAGPILVREGRRQKFRAAPDDAYELSSMLEQHPRSALGWNQQCFFLVQVDGRQRDLSVGMTLDELASYLVKLGCEQALNLDGGGSTCLVVMDSTGHPLPLNRDSASLAINRERTVGAHFGVYALPLPGFFENVQALPDNITATISWTTVSPATTQLQYWTSPTYEDASWDGPSPGALWADIRGVNEEITMLLSTQMPENPDTGYPFATYYFRTHFTYTHQLSGVSLILEHAIDDGAVFYLNGTEIYRLRLPDPPTVIYNATRADDYPCSGNATCSETLSLSGPVISTNLQIGDNVLAVEVHNYNPASPDITFSLSGACTVPFVSRPSLNLSYSNHTITLNWSRGGFTLQEAADSAGAWTDVPGPVVSSPFTTHSAGPIRFFRLRQ